MVTTYGSYDVTLPTIGTNGILYCGAGFNVIAISASGILQWTYSVVGYVIYPPSIGANGALYAAGGAGIYALTSTGKLIWTYFADQSITSMVTIAPDRSLYFSTYDRYLYSLNAAGTLMWKHNKYSLGDFSMVIGDNGTLYARSYFGNSIMAINATGDTQWRYQTYQTAINDFIKKLPVLGADEVVYIVNDNKVLALNTTGNLLWNFTGEYALTGSPALGSDGTIYVIGKQEKYPYKSLAYAINSNGTLKWIFTGGYDGGGYVASPTVGGDGTIYVSLFDNYLYALTPEGSVKWSYVAYETSLALGADGTLYANSNGLRDFHDPSPTSQPTSQPTNPTGQPSTQPSHQRSRQPSSKPSSQPTRQPTSRPSRHPSSQPTSSPSFICAAGNYATSRSGERLCIACPIGTYSATAGALYLSSCLSCATGSYNSFLDKRVALNALLKATNQILDHQSHVRSVLLVSTNHILDGAVVKLVLQDIIQHYLVLLIMILVFLVPLIHTQGRAVVLFAMPVLLILIMHRQVVVIYTVE
jgi:outer membrane protein assembly factor BamB